MTFVLLGWHLWPQSVANVSVALAAVDSYCSVPTHISHKVRLYCQAVMKEMLPVTKSTWSDQGNLHVCVSVTVTQLNVKNVNYLIGWKLISGVAMIHCCGDITQLWRPQHTAQSIQHIIAAARLTLH